MLQNTQRTDKAKAESQKVLDDLVSYLDNHILPNIVSTKGPSKGKVPKGRQQTFDNARTWLTVDAPAIDNLVDKFNLIKHELDAAHQAKEWERFASALTLLEELIAEGDVGTYIRRVKMARYRCMNKVMTIAKANLRFMYNTRDRARAELKRSKMSDAQLAAAKKASKRMKAQWN